MEKILNLDTAKTPQDERIIISLHVAIKTLAQYPGAVTLKKPIYIYGAYPGAVGPAKGTQVQGRFRHVDIYRPSGARPMFSIFFKNSMAIFDFFRLSGYFSTTEY